MTNINEDQNLDALIVALDKTRGADFEAAVEKLTKSGSERAVEALISVLRHAAQLEEANTVGIVSAALAKIGNPIAIAPLIESMAVTSLGHVYRALIEKALTQFGPRAISALITALGNEDVSIRWGAGKALSAMGPATVAPLLKLLSEGPDIARSEAAESLARIGDVRAVGPLISALDSDNHEFVAAAVSALSHFANRRVRDSLIELVDHPSPEVRSAVAWALARFPDTNVIQSLIALLKDGDDDVSRGAMASLAAIGEPSIAPLAVELVASDEWRRIRAGKTLAQIGGIAVRPLLTTLEDSDARVRTSAALSLGDFVARQPKQDGQFSAEDLAARKAVTEHLLSSLDDPDFRVRRTSAHSLGGIYHNADAMIGRGDLDVDRIVDALSTLIERTNEPARQAGAESLLKLATEPEPILKALKHGKLSVRHIMATAITQHIADIDVARIGASFPPWCAVDTDSYKQAFEPLIPGEEEASGMDSSTSTRSMSESARKIMDALSEIMRDPEYRIRLAARGALETIRKKLNEFRYAGAGGPTLGLVGPKPKRLIEEQVVAAAIQEAAAHIFPPRYTNVCITKRKARSVLTSRCSLRARGHYALRLNIGKWRRESVVQHPRAFRVDLLPSTEEGHWLEVVIASDEFRVEQRYYHIFLPRVGESYVCRCKPAGEHTCKPNDRQPYLFVPIVAPGLIRPVGEGPGSTSLGPAFAPRTRRSRQARLRIAIYYQKNLVESQLLTADVRAVEGRGTGYSSRIDYSLTSHLSDVSFLPPRALNFLTNDVDDKTHKLIINGDMKEPILVDLAETRIKDAIEAARQALRDISVKVTQGFGATIPTIENLYGVDNERDLDAFVTDLRTLAPLGWKLWSALLQTQPQSRRKLISLLRQSPARPAKIQVSRVQGSSLVFPWSFIYELPLETDSNKHLPCRVLTKGTWKPESISALDRCPFEQDHFEDGRPKKNLLCPFGFWGFNHIIEQVPSMPEGRPLPLWIKRAHNKPQLVMGISLDLDSKLTEAHKNKLQQQLTALQIIPRDSLTDVETALAEEKLELVYFYCHGRREPLPGGKSSTPYIEVGKAQGIAPADITAWFDSDWDASHWQETSPLVFINGCHTAELTPDVLVNFVDSFIGAYAAGVIGTEILLLQEIANEAAEQLLSTVISSDKTGKTVGVGEALRRMRLHFLGKGNLLGLAYTPYCSTDLKLAN